MQGFGFRTTPALEIGTRRSAATGELCRGLGIGHAFLVSDPGVRAAGLTGPAEASLAEAGIAVTLWDDVTADPPEHAILAAADAARAAGADGVIGLGGGSPMDTAKIVALLLGTDQPIGGAYGVGNARGPRAPLVLIPTTAGTGSEVTPVAIVTTGETEKMGIVSPHLLPDAAILDAALTTGLPRHVTAATGIDAMVHAIEAFTSRHRKNALSDMMAREALRLLGAHIVAACETPEDMAAREGMLLGSTLAGMAFANAPVAAVHALAYPLGGHFKIPHGHANAMVLPHVLNFNRAEPAAEAAYAALAPHVFPALEGQDQEMTVDSFIAELAELGPSLGLPVRLSENGINQGDLDLLATDAMKQTRLLVNNPREMKVDDARAVYARAL
ncbi:MAG: iron-containing alcohol dehydrogenase [Pseudomonadota bacterium]